MIGKKRIHLMKDDDRKGVPELKDVHIDIGAQDGADAVRGSRWNCRTGHWCHARWTIGSGCYVALEVVRMVADAGGAVGDVAAVAAVHEDITFAGPRTTAFSSIRRGGGGRPALPRTGRGWSWAS